jgi:regulator of replication initiation timing
MSFRPASKFVTLHSGLKGRINFNSVSMESGVSKAYLYNHSDVRERIKVLEEENKRLKSELANIRGKLHDEA